VIVHQSLIDLEKAYGSVRGEAVYNILIEFSVPILFRPIIMCLNETYNKARIGENLYDSFLFRII